MNFQLGFQLGCSVPLLIQLGKFQSQKVEDAMLLAYLEERQSRLDQGEKKEVAKKKHKVISTLDELKVAN